MHYDETIGINGKSTSYLQYWIRIHQNQNLSKFTITKTNLIHSKPPAIPMKKKKKKKKREKK